jgi:hypothetical protein
MVAMWLFYINKNDIHEFAQSKFPQQSSGDKI